jgi:hypothetical protein
VGVAAGLKANAVKSLLDESGGIGFHTLIHVQLHQDTVHLRIRLTREWSDPTCRNLP